jgi:putative PIN family toxin of toxin-antitoxin system
VLLSACILDELRRVLPKLGHRHGLSPAEIEDLVDALSIQAEVIEPVATDVPALRDAEDRPVLGTLAALRSSGAVYLVTGDRDLLALASEYPIITPAAFWSAHGGG